MKRTSRVAGSRVACLGGICAAMAVLLLSGCDSMVHRGGEMEDRNTASAVRDPVLQDIPKPAGFRLAADRSMVTNIGRFRLAQCEYVGSGDAGRIKRFYEEYLPTAGFAGSGSLWGNRRFRGFRYSVQKTGEESAGGWKA